MKKRKKLTVNPFKEVCEDVLQVEILPFLKDKEVVKISTLNKSIKQTCSNSMLWRNLSIIKFSKERLNKLKIYYTNLGNNWKEIYKRLVSISRICQKDYDEFYDFIDNTLSEYNSKIEYFQNLFGFNKERTTEIVNGKYFKEDIKLFQRLTYQTQIDGDFKFIGEICDGEKDLGKTKGIEYEKNDNGFFEKIYEGDFMDGGYSGFGKIFHKNREIYEGGLFNNTYHGYGEYYFRTGNIYKGEYKNGKKCGKGKFFYDEVNFNLLHGEWNDGKLDGKCNFYHNETESRVEKTYKNNEVESIKLFKEEGKLAFKGFMSEYEKIKGVLYDENEIFIGEFYPPLSRLLSEGVDSKMSSFTGDIIDKNTKEVLMDGKWENGVNKKYPDNEKLHFLLCYKCIQYPIRGNVYEVNNETFCKNCI